MIMMIGNTEQNQYMVLAGSRYKYRKKNTPNMNKNGDSKSIQTI
jgi:hypothetical protein